MTTMQEEPRTVTGVVAGLDIRGRAFIDGEYVDALRARLRLRQPRDGETIAQVAACDTADVDRAVKAARAAFEAGVWSRRAPKSARRRCSASRR